MNVITTATPRIPANEAAGHLARLLTLAGYRPEAPPHVTEATRRIDAGTCRRLKCRGCGKRGMSYHPWGNAEGRYRAVAVCDCGLGHQI